MKFSGKTLAALIAATMIVSTLTACGSSSSESSTASSSSAAGEASSAAPAESTGSSDGDRIIAAAQEGKVGFYYRDLVSGETLGWHADEPFLAASVIKLPIFMYLAKLDAEGALSLSERVKVREADKVPICGALPLFTDEPECDLRTLCNLMISLSDNTATNVLIERLGIEAYNRGFREMGLKKTVLQRKLFDATASAAGKENRVVPEEMGMLLEQVYRREFVNPQVSEMILDIKALMIKAESPISVSSGLCFIISMR